MSTTPGTKPYLDEADQRLTVTETGRRRDVVRVAVTGDLDIATTALFHRRLSNILDNHLDGQPLELDLSALVFCDLTGLRALHTLGRAYGQAQRRVQITTAGPALDVLLGLCQTSTILGYTPTPDPRKAD
ncbi:STAS domain-containing protein [Actinoplanes sp. NEAU-A12]|uniref:STAS domain-containing protein n=1 Tax=Actinoplanes sandaracinus TaxID=3045177 RepID=A0ABT6WX77_9ACTN|nr:STAS domain-containing protein [Actinoplanes sandaracinus]MDI6104340.1 STAS domain-containing protein [Actinoplanes sandaracinus]